MRLIWVFALLLSVLSSCKEYYSANEDWIYAKRVKEEFPTDDITWAVQEYVTELSHEKQLYLQSSYFCIGEHGRTLRLEFTSQALLEDVCEGREFLVDVVEGLLFRMNNRYVDPVLRPDPFLSDHLEIYIKFESFYGEFVDPYYMGWIALENNMAYYYAFNLDNRRLNAWDAHQEPYFKSRSIAMAQKEAERSYRLVHPKKTRIPNLNVAF